MALITKAIKGTKDVLPKEAYKNQYIELTAKDVASRFGYKEIRTPVFEHTELKEVLATPPMLFKKRCTLSMTKAAEA